MPHQIGFVDNSGGVLAHYKMLETIRDFASANGWTVLRYDTAPVNRELILRGSGHTGEEEIFIGFQTYQNAGTSIYNLAGAVFTGYVPGSTFSQQPGYRPTSCCAHDLRIDYWLTVNPQRIALAMKVGTSVYESLYVGKFLPYARPTQYPYPVACVGTLAAFSGTRFTDISANHSMGYKGNSNRISFRTIAGWNTPFCYPWDSADLAGTTQVPASQLRDTDGVYPLLPVELHNNLANLYGALDGIYYISGFNNNAENTLSVDGHDYVVIQDAFRTDFTDHYAMRLDD